MVNLVWGLSLSVMLQLQYSTSWVAERCRDFFRMATEGKTILCVVFFVGVVSAV